MTLFKNNTPITGGTMFKKPDAQKPVSNTVSESKGRFVDNIPAKPNVATEIAISIAVDKLRPKVAFIWFKVSLPFSAIKQLFKGKG